MLEILDTQKPMYAKALTDNLVKLDKDKMPPKIIDFFKKIIAGV